LKKILTFDLHTVTQITSVYSNGVTHLFSHPYLRLRQEHHKFKASLGYIAGLCFKNKKK